MRKLKCFRCGTKFDYYIGKKLVRCQVYRDEYNYPVCEECLHEIINDCWDEDDSVFYSVKNRYDNSYKKFMEDVIFYDCVACGCSYGRYKTDIADCCPECGKEYESRSESRNI